MSGGYYAQGGAQVFAGRYQLVQKIGEGGFGVVYKAVQLTTRQSVAIKVLQLDKAQGADQSEVERFQREMEVIGRLNHPNIVRLVDAGQTDQGELFTVLEFIDGEELKDYVARRGGLPCAARRATGGAWRNGTGVHRSPDARQRRVHGARRPRADRGRRALLRA